MTDMNIYGHEENVVNRLAEKEMMLKRLREDMSIPMEEYRNGECVPLDMDAIIQEAETKYTAESPRA